MLKFFQLEKNFNKLRVTMTVDCKANSIDVMIVYDRIIIRQESIPFHEVYGAHRLATVEDAEKWLRRPMGERGNYVEYVEWMCRAGILKKEEMAA